MISCIIPVFNESKTILQVVRAALATKSIAEIVIVNDGSTDETATLLSQIRSPKFRLINLDRNQGKTTAVLAGLKCVRGDTLLLLDGDLVGLKSKHLDTLLRPIISSPNTAAFAFLGNAPGIARQMGINAVSGQRAFPRKAIEELTQTHSRGFSLEVLLNDVFLKQHYKIRVIPWPEVSHLRKFEKRGYLKGWLEDDWMTLKLILDFGLPHLIHQYRELARRAQH